MYWPLPAQRQRGRLVTTRVRRQGAATSSTKLWAGSQLLTMSSWDPIWLTSARRVTTWDQVSRGDIRHLRWYSPSASRKPRARAGEVIKMHSPSGTARSPSTWSPELLRPGEGTEHMPNPQRLSQNCVWVFPMEVQVSSGLLQGQGLWVQQTWVWNKPSWRRSPLTPP